MINKKNKNQEKGVSILFTIFLMSIILAIAVGINTILLFQTKMVTQIGFSTVAFYAANTGIERSLATDPPPPGEFTDEPLSNGALYTVEYQAAGGDCTAGLYCVKSIGTYQDSFSRAIEVIK